MKTLEHDDAIFRLVESIFGPPLSLTEGFGTPVDNSWNRLGMEDEREKADLDVHGNIQGVNSRRTKDSEGR